MNGGGSEEILILLGGGGYTLGIVAYGCVVYITHIGGYTSNTSLKKMGGSTLWVGGYTLQHLPVLVSDW